MNKEKQIQECERKRLIDELSKMPPMVIATAYLHAINYTLYGEDVTEKWLTATQQASALEKAYNKGYYDAFKECTNAIDSIQNAVIKDDSQRQTESFDFDKVKEILKRNDLDDLIVDHTCGDGGAEGSE